MDNYMIFAPASRASFADRLAELERRIGAFADSESGAGRRLVYAKIFLSDILNQNAQVEASGLYALLSRQAAVSIVGQAPLDGSKIAVLVHTSDTREQFFVHCMRMGEDEAAGLDSYGQTVALFDRYLRWAGERGLDMATHLVRTWIYISDIDTNYDGVVRARNDIFARHGLTAGTHYIASTGIGGQTAARHGRVAIDFLTFPGIGERQKKYLKAPGHLNPTHEYGVAFERATRLDTASARRIYVSGTASIDSCGRVLYPGDVCRQTGRLIENIGALLADGGATLGGIRYFLVYLRDVSDYAAVDAVFAARFPGVPRVVLHAPVCRPGWLVEAECVADADI